MADRLPLTEWSFPTLEETISYPDTFFFGKPILPKVRVARDLCLSLAEAELLKVT
jgi:hypothetical protein